MNAHHDELERMLGSDLHRQVDGMVEVPFGLEDVTGRAARIRRNRRLAAGVGVAAALAVIVPTALTGSEMLGGTREIEPAPSPSRSLAPSPDAPVEVARTTLTLDGLDRGDAPAIEYFTPDGVVLPGEGTRTLPENYQALVPGTGDGWIALSPASDEVVYLSEDFEREGGTASGSSLATTPARDYAAWTVPLAGTQTIYLRSTSRPEETMSWDLPQGPLVEPVGILRPDSVVYETNSQGDTAVGIARPDGTTTELRYVGARAVDPVNGLIAVQTESRLASGCFGVVEASSLELAWQTCDYALGSFSPDGRYVMATAAEADVLSVLYVLDAQTGEPVAEFVSEGPTPVTLITPAWESAGTIVAAALEGRTNTLVRLQVDGTAQEVGDPVEIGASEDVHYFLGADRAGL